MSIDNKDKSKVTGLFIRCFKLLQSRSTHLAGTTEHVAPTFAALSSVDGEADLNKKFLPFLNYHAHCKGAVSALLSALALCAKDRMRGHLVSDKGTKIQALYASNWLQQIKCGQALEVRRQNIQACIAKNRDNINKLESMCLDLNTALIQVEPFKALFGCQDVVDEARAIYNDAAAFVATAAIVSVTVVGRLAKESGKKDEEQHIASAKGIIDIVTTNDNILDSEIKEEFWSIIPGMKPGSATDKKGEPQK